MYGKDKNTLFFERLYLERSLSNQEFAKYSGLSPSSISNFLAKLTPQGSILEIDSKQYDKEKGSNERKKKTFGLNPDYGYAIVIELDFDFVVVRKLRFDLSLAFSNRIAVAEHSKEGLFELIDKEIVRVIKKSGEERCLGLGFTVIGQVDADRKTLMRSTRLRYMHDTSFEYFAKHNPNIAVENVSNAYALGEKVNGSARKMDHFFTLNVGNGVGMGIIINGGLYRGFGYAAGEAGHIILNEGNGSAHTCLCGNKGCLESFISKKAVYRQLLEMKENDVSSEIFQDEAFEDSDEVYSLLGRYFEKGDKVAFLILNDVAQKLGLACTNITHLMAPECLILGGAITALGDSFLDLVSQNMRRYILPWAEQTKIRFGKDCEFSSAYGVGYIVFMKHVEQISV